VKVRLHETSELPWRRVGDMSPGAGSDSSNLHAGVADTRIRNHEAGTESEPEMFEVEYGPGGYSTPHWHDVSEIIYIVEGEMHVGVKVLGAGSSLFIEKEAVYSFKAGPQGVKFVNFRPRGGAGTHRKKAS
jgi:quercetin dioxygenase-like cupin family protein